MLTIAQIAAIIGLLLAFDVPQPTVDRVSVILNNSITHQATSTMPDVPATTMPSAPAPQPTVQPAPTAAPVSQARIEVAVPKGPFVANDYKVNPDGTLAAGSTEPRPENSANIGAVLYNPDGSINRSAIMAVTATDGDQGAIMVGTGNVQAYYVDGAKRERYYYAYHYEFRSKGKHTITFEAQGVTASVELEAK